MSVTKLKVVTAALLGVVAFGAWAGSGLSSATHDGPERRATVDAPKTGPPAPEKARGPAFDLAKLDRTIAKEPKYKSKTPKYCLLVFGPEAKTRVWLVHDGDALYADRNGNGDLTEEGERVAATDDLVHLEGASFEDENHPGTLVLKVPFKLGTVTETDGKTKHTVWVGASGDGGNVRHLVGADVAGKYLQMTDLGFRFGDRPKDAPIVHLGGPLALHPWAPEGAPAPLIRGEKAGALLVRVGTAGLGKYYGGPKDPHKRS